VGRESEAVIRIVLAAEDDDGAWAARVVAERLQATCEGCPGLAWIDPPGGGDYVAWKNLGALCRQHVRQTHRLRGHFADDEAEEGANEVRRLLVLVESTVPHAAIVLAARDCDRSDRLGGFVQATRTFHDAAAAKGRRLPFEPVAAYACQEVEAWFVGTWQPEDDAERELHRVLRREVGFDPVTCSHDLVADSKRSTRNCKVILGRLVANRASHRDHFTRAETLWEQAGATNGLAAFVRDLREALRAVAARPRGS
jgi:hypothetical protein